MPAVGHAVPPFSLPASQGQIISDQSLRGSFTVLYFYPKDHTSGCTLEGQDFQNHLPEFRDLGAHVVGISRDPIRSHERFSEKHGFSFPLASDQDETVCRLFGVIKEKKMYGKSVMGIERSTFLIGPDGTLRRQWRKVKVKGHVAEVLAALKAIVS